MPNAPAADPAAPKKPRRIPGWNRLSLNEVLRLAGWTVERSDSGRLGRRNHVFDENGIEVADEAGAAWHALRRRGLVGKLECEKRGDCFECGQAKEVA